MTNLHFKVWYTEQDSDLIQAANLVIPDLVLRAKLKEMLEDDIDSEVASLVIRKVDTDEP